MSPRVLHTLNFEECQFFHPDPKTPSQKHYKISCSRNANLNFLFSVESIKHLVMTILPTKYKKVCKRICPSKSRAITKFAIAQLKETVLLFWQTKQEQVLILHSLLNHKPNQALAALGATAHNKLSQLVMNQKHSASSFAKGGQSFCGSGRR